MDERSIAIVTHVWAHPCRHYATMLRFQWASILHNPPKNRGTFWIVHTEEDAITKRTVKDILESIPRGFPFAVRSLVLPLEKFFRRAIARNIVSKTLDETCVWYCDVDYVFGAECLNTVVENVGENDGLSYPNGYFIQVDHATGDDMVSKYLDAEGQVWPAVDPTLFSFRDKTPAIGGIQIIGRSEARAIGYCDGTKWLNPVDPTKGFSCYRDDSWYRRAYGKPARPIDVPALYRIRHSENGRDFALDGSRHMTT